MTTTTITVEVPADHILSLDTVAQELAVQPATVKRYLRAGKLTRLGNGISADSVAAYTATRTLNVQRTRFRPAPVAVEQLTDVELAAEAWAEAGRLEALARDLKAQARPVLDAAGAGRHGRYDVRLTAGRTMQDNEAVKAHYAELDLAVPTKKAAGSFKVVRVDA
jgi:hypothetical protein